MGNGGYFLQGLANTFDPVSLVKAKYLLKASNAEKTKNQTLAQLDALDNAQQMALSIGDTGIYNAASGLKNDLNQYKSNQDAYSIGGNMSLLNQQGGALAPETIGVGVNNAGSKLEQIAATKKMEQLQAKKLQEEADKEQNRMLREGTAKRAEEDQAWQAEDRKEAEYVKVADETLNRLYKFDYGDNRVNKQFKKLYEVDKKGNLVKLDVGSLNQLINGMEANPNSLKTKTIEKKLGTVSDLRTLIDIYDKKVKGFRNVN